MFDSFEKRFDLPALLIECCNRGCTEVHVIGYELQLPVVVYIGKGNEPDQLERIDVAGSGIAQFNDQIFNDARLLIGFF